MQFKLLYITCQYVEDSEQYILLVGKIKHKQFDFFRGQISDHGMQAALK
jgi:hypothetical protein